MARTRARFYDPTGARHGGVPTWPWKMAPPHLLTYRQLAARGLRPGGQPIAGQILWASRKGVRAAYLYDLASAKPQRPMTDAKYAAVMKAVAARRVCSECGIDRGYQPSKLLGCCNVCAELQEQGAAA
jgi:hypothetical protein